MNYPARCSLPWLILPEEVEREREREGDFISPRETILRELLSSIIHETSPHRTYHQVHTWEIKRCHPFRQLRPRPLSEKCARDPLSSVKLLPRVGREKAVSQKVSPGFLSMSLICQEPCTARGRNLVLFLTGFLKTAATFVFFSLSLLQ